MLWQDVSGARLRMFCQVGDSFQPVDIPRGSQASRIVTVLWNFLPMELV
jgi:hypothetical protein